jgi:hypothetical protein
MDSFPSEKVHKIIKQVDASRLKDDVYYLAKKPLPYRKANFTLPGHSKSTLAEADDFIRYRLTGLGYPVILETCQVQAFRCDRNKPLHHWYSPPLPEDPRYRVHNLYAVKTGSLRPEEIIVVVSHKDSPSWYDSPGAYDNAVGTAANLEIARTLSPIGTKRTIWHLFCNEEHTPWTSVFAAEGAARRGKNIIAVINLDSLGGKSKESIDAGLKTNVSRYSTREGRSLAELMEQVVKAYHISLQQKGYEWDKVNDDDGSFINAGFRAAIINVGSFPYVDPNYHMEGDIPENVDFDNVALSTQASLAAIAHLALSVS